MYGPGKSAHKRSYLCILCATYLIHLHDGTASATPRPSSSKHGSKTIRFILVVIFVVNAFCFRCPTTSSSCTRTSNARFFIGDHVVEPLLVESVGGPEVTTQDTLCVLLHGHLPEIEALKLDDVVWVDRGRRRGRD